LITLGVADVEGAAAFCGALGWPRSSGSVEGKVAFIATAGAVISLYGLDGSSMWICRVPLHDLGVHGRDIETLDTQIVDPDSAILHGRRRWRRLIT
jgi:hypothetical protein